MRKEYRRAVREEFAERLADLAPGFRLAKVESPLLFGGESVFQWSPGGGFIGWLLLIPDTKRQAFTLEVGWSRVERFPELGMRPSVMLGPDDALPVDVPEGFVRLGGLSARTDLWWELPDPALARPSDLSALAVSLEPISRGQAAAHAAKPVAAAMQVVDGHALPFLEEAGRAAGVAASPRVAHP